MIHIDNLWQISKNIISKLYKIFLPVRWKEYQELSYWKLQKKAEVVMKNDHYEYFYTDHFRLERHYYNNKTLLDIGCGPRGSLEWASMACRRIGLDPLAREYLRLGASQHRMEYIAAPSEEIPLPDESCDAVFSFNSLDHVDDVDQTLREIKRVTRPGGIFLLLVEVNHPPTDCEPNYLTPCQLVESLKQEFECEDLRVYQPVCQGIYQSIKVGEQLAHPLEVSVPGYLSAKFIRRSTCC